MNGETLAAWRKVQRTELLAARAALSPEQHGERNSAIHRQLARLLPAMPQAVGFYWPFRGEVNILPVMERHVAAGGKAALPFIVGRGQPLRFREWSPVCAMREGAYGIAYPAEGSYMQPILLLIPLLGFDANGYRLGYGGGYYDRTLAAVEPKPRTMGIGLELGRLTTIHPQPFDVPMDCIVTEAGVWQRTV